MEIQANKNAGAALIAGSLLLVATMILHPSGGSVEHLIRIQRIIIISHSIAILSIPFSFTGFMGLTRRLGTDNFFSISGFSIMTFGLVAVLGAAATNGLALPIFVQKYVGASPETLASIKPVLRYNFALNHAFDYIYMGAMCLSILFWSVAILQTRTLPRSLGYFGLVLAVVGGVMLLAGFDFVGLQGFRIFVLGSVGWIVAAGIRLLAKAA